METEINEKKRRLLWRLLQQSYRKAVKEFSLISEGDKILVGLSGGKDSLLLLEMLAAQARIFVPHITVEAVHVRMENIEYESDANYLKLFAEKLGIPLHVLTTSFNPDTDKRKSPCFLCSWNRRKQMFKLAQDEGFNKIALGHHQDDIIHTALMNEFFQGRYDTMPAILRMEKMPLSIIRPLCLMKESDIRKYASLSAYRQQRKICPYDKATNRETVAEIFRKIEDLNPEARHSIWNAIQRAGLLVKSGDID